MHKNLKRAGFLGVSLVLAACVYPANTPRYARSGEQLARQECAGCHAIVDDEASPHPRAPPLTRLYRLYPIDALNQAFTRGMEVGHRDMPRFAFSPDEVSRLVDYLRSLDPCGRRPSDPEAMAKCFEPMAR